jgi:hypothetical protein
VCSLSVALLVATVGLPNYSGRLGFVLTLVDLSDGMGGGSVLGLPRDIGTVRESGLWMMNVPHFSLSCD